MFFSTDFLISFNSDALDDVVYRILGLQSMKERKASLHDVCPYPERR